ncbi:YeeE/YedE family protein [Aerophototrophica crusticola]|uniref:YeeE/YedE family protein n=1 Tax=Aerophototrophica crusticola TaxID=1709002 RepID=A0A858R613_9PROT|nr:YeeE/YedE family protein [Rhodospirillaceae bacterium B3]
MRALAALIAGLLFGLGLTLSGMLDPAKVLGFLDLAGAWDPTLAAVLAGAVGVTLAATPLVLRRRSPLFAPSFQLPTRQDIDAPLLLGSALFGVGWGLVGFCPGPALAALSVVPGKASLFVLSMLAGMALHVAWSAWQRRTHRRAHDPGGITPGLTGRP